jgi:hypothetical protein
MNELPSDFVVRCQHFGGMCCLPLGTAPKSPVAGSLFLRSVSPSRISSILFLLLLPVGARDTSLLQNVRADLGPTQPPIQWVLGCLPGVRRPRRDADHSAPSSIEVKNECRHTSTPPVCLHGLDRDSCTFYFYALS